MCCILFLCIPAVRNNPVREIHNGNYRDNNSCKYYKSDESFSKVSTSSVPGPVSFFNIRLFRFVLRKVHSFIFLMMLMKESSPRDHHTRCRLLRQPSGAGWFQSSRGLCLLPVHMAVLQGPPLQPNGK